MATKLDKNPKQYSTAGSQTEYHFRDLDSVTQYNVTVQGLQQNTKLWFISSNFATTDKGIIYCLNHFFSAKKFFRELNLL